MYESMSINQKNHAANGSGQTNIGTVIFRTFACVNPNVPFI